MRLLRLSAATGIGTLALWLLAATWASPAASAERHACPRGAGHANFDAGRLEDRKLPAARRLAARHDCSVRVVRRDGESLLVTDDLRRARINVAVRHGWVRRVVGVY